MKLAGKPFVLIALDTQCSSTLLQSDGTDAEEAVKPTNVTLPYVQGLSESIKRILTRLQNVEVRFRPETTLRKLLVRAKDPVPTSTLNGIIYRIPCKDCEHAYVGQSRHSLHCRVKEHQRAVRNGDTNASALAEHAWNEEHHITSIGRMQKCSKLTNSTGEKDAYWSLGILTKKPSC